MPDTYTYQPADMAGAEAAYAQQYGGINTQHQAKKKWYRKYRSWAEYWRDTTQGALYGLNGTQPTDPMAQLQNQLMAQYNAAAPTAKFSEDFDFSGMVSARNKGMAQQLQQRAAGMGVQGAYQGVMDTSNMARQTLVNQSLAAYRPMAYQAQQQITGDTDKLLEAMAQADFEGRKALTSAGRGA